MALPFWETRLLGREFWQKRYYMSYFLVNTGLHCFFFFLHLLRFRVYFNFIWTQHLKYSEVKFILNLHCFFSVWKTVFNTKSSTHLQFLSTYWCLSNLSKVDIYTTKKYGAKEAIDRFSFNYLIRLVHNNTITGSGLNNIMVLRNKINHLKNIQ